MRIILLLLFSFCSYAQNINVYLVCDEPNLYQSVQDFNSYLDHKGVFTRYEVEPFLNNHPLHVTLFLADYSKEQLPSIRRTIAAIAKATNPIPINTTQFESTASNYVLLGIDNQQQTDGKNTPLQRLSDLITLSLTERRNYNAPIPDWVETVPNKKRAFLFYGSPNVFFEYSPHFSVLAKKFTDSAQATLFQKEMTELIAAYPLSPQQRIESTHIAIGYADSFGQITEEIARFALNQSSS